MDIVTVIVGPLASASGNGYATLQTPSAAYTLNGALVTGFSAINIAAAQAVGSATNLTLNGTLASGGVAYLTSPTITSRSVSITSAGNDSGISFTVYGATAMVPGIGYMYGSETVTGTNTSVVSTRTRFLTVTRVASSGAAAGNVSVGTNGYVVNDKPRRMSLVFASPETSKVVTITGLDWSGNPVSEAVVLTAASTQQSLYDYSVVYLVTVSATLSDQSTLGTNGVASSRPIFLDRFCLSPTSLQVVVSGTVNYTVTQTLDSAEINSQYVDQPQTNNYANVTWVNYPDSVFVAATATAQGNYAYIPNMTRITLNSGTGTVTYKVLQAANVPL